MGGKLHIKRNVVPHIFSELKTYTSQIDQKIVDTYNKKFNKFSDNEHGKSSISVLKSPKGRLVPDPGEVINIYDSNIEIKEQENIISIKEELENSSSSVAEYNYVFIKTECEDNNDKTESIIKETESGTNVNNFTNMFIKSECEGIDEQTQSKMEEIDIEWNNVSIKTECKNINDNTKRNLEEANAEFKINNFTNVLIKSECEGSNEQIQSNVEQIDREYNEMHSTNMSSTGPDGNIVYIKMEPNTDHRFVKRLPENKNEYQAVPYANRNIIIVTNGFDISADKNIIENNILIEETNNIITYSQNELVSVNENMLCKKNTVYKACTNGQIQTKSSLYDNNKMLSDMNQYQCTGLFHSEHWLADWFVTCMVPQCSKTKKYNPNTRFFKSPKDIRWETWLKAIYLNPEILEHKTTYYICEDHFDLPNDLENWENYQKNREHPKLKPHVLPSLVTLVMFVVACIAIIVFTSLYITIMVFSCSSCGRKYAKACGVRFFSYPKNPFLRTEWLKACRLDLHPKNDTSKMKLCSDHFEKSSFLITRKNGPLILKPNSIPTVFGKKKFSYVNEECKHVQYKDIKMEEASTSHCGIEFIDVNRIDNNDKLLNNSTQTDDDKSNTPFESVNIKTECDPDNFEDYNDDCAQYNASVQCTEELFIKTEIDIKEEVVD
ncbi:MBD-R2 [Carabus blaptoides fortunei]